MIEVIKYVAFLRGINVGGHHKVPMKELKVALQKLNLQNIVTLLNSGNIIFEATPQDIEHLQEVISVQLEKTFGFSVPTILRTAYSIMELLRSDPFDGIELTKDLRFYVSFLGADSDVQISFPWYSEDEALKIIEKIDLALVSVVDVSVSNTPKAMNNIERYYGPNITTRNWNTILKIGEKL